MSCNMKNGILTVALLLVSLVGYSQTTQENPAMVNTEASTDLPDIFYSAKVLNRVPPVYPQDQLNAGIEGWVVLSYVISAEGKVIDPIVLDSNSKHFERAALRSLQQYSYTPARFNGENVEQCSNYVTITFQIEDYKVVPRRFANNYNQMIEAINGGETEIAKAYLEKLEGISKKTLYQDAWSWWAKYLFAKHIKDEDTKFESLLKAVAYNDQFLPDEMYAMALAELFLARMSRMQVALALKELEKLRSTKGAEKYLTHLASYIQSVETTINRNQPLLIKASIKNSSNTWKHTLFRNSFMIDNIAGTLSKYELRCSFKRISGDIVAGKKITIPENWGKNCMVILTGESESNFEFYEV